MLLLCTIFFQHTPFFKPLAKTGSCRFISMCMCVWTHNTPTATSVLYTAFTSTVSSPTSGRIHNSCVSPRVVQKRDGTRRPPYTVTFSAPRSFLRAHTNIVQFFVDFIRRVLQINGMRKLCQVQRFCFRLCLISFRPDSGEIVTLLKVWYSSLY